MSTTSAVQENALKAVFQSRLFRQNLYVARDPDGALYMFTNLPPIKGQKGMWTTHENSDCIMIDKALYPGLKSSDLPMEVSIHISPENLFSFEEMVILKYITTALKDLVTTTDLEYTLSESILEKLGKIIAERKIIYQQQQATPTSER